MPARTPITVAHGDGIGPEIMSACLRIMDSAGAALEMETIEIGEKVYLRGNASGIEPQSWESLLRTRVFYKAPITTPPGGGYKNLNVATRKILGQYANVRPCVSYHPFVDTKHPTMDLVVVRESEEDLYAGVEYQLSPEMTSAIKLISRPGTEKIVRYAFEYARRHNRRKVTCFTKDNILKMTDGLFHRVYNEIAAEYPDIQKEHWIVDAGAAKMADTPEAFDVVVMPNQYGDLLSGLAAQIAGSIGLAASANIGDHCSTFEAIHGASPRRAGRNLANPSGLLLGGVLLLVHINQPDVAERVHNAWLRTIEDGIHTYDIFAEGVSREKVGTKEFACAVIARLGQKPNILKPVSYAKTASSAAGPATLTPPAAGKTEPGKIELRGIDVIVHWPSRNPKQLHAAVSRLAGNGIELEMIDNRGVIVWPEGPAAAETFCTDSFRCRFFAEGSADAGKLIDLVRRISDAGVDVVMTSTLRAYAGREGFSLAQGQ